MLVLDVGMGWLALWRVAIFRSHGQLCRIVRRTVCLDGHGLVGRLVVVGISF